jgi:hypothetical protein
MANQFLVRVNDLRRSQTKYSTTAEASMTIGALPFHLARWRLPTHAHWVRYSHSMVPGGLLVISSTTRFT